MGRINRKIKSILNYNLFKKKADVKVSKSAIVDNDSVFEGNNYIGRNTEIINSKLGYSSYVGDNCYIENTQIGRYSSIAKSFNVVMGRHPSSVFVSTSPMFYSPNHILKKKYVSESKFDEYRYTANGFSVVIGNDVWIGQNVSCADGITIGDGVIVGSCSNITTDLEPYGIYVGNPAKLLRYRFSKEQIEKLESIKWWDKDERWISSHADLFEDIDVFLGGFNATKD